jgi:hypothetical protein
MAKGKRKRRQIEDMSTEWIRGALNSWEPLVLSIDMWESERALWNQRLRLMREELARRDDDNLVRFSTFLRKDQIARMRQIHEDQGVTVAEQIRRAIDAALKGSKA